MFASTVSSAGSRAIICKDKYSIPRDVMLLRRFFFVLVATLLLPKVCKWMRRCCQSLPGPSPQQSRCQSPVASSRDQQPCRHGTVARVAGGGPRTRPGAPRVPSLSCGPSRAIPPLRGGLGPAEYFNSCFLTILSCVCMRWIVVCSSEVTRRAAWNHRPRVTAGPAFFSGAFLSLLPFRPHPSLPFALCSAPPASPT